MADSLQDNQENLQDDVQNLTENSEIFEKVTIYQLQQKYGIGRGPLYERMKYLKITTYKESGKAYLCCAILIAVGAHDRISRCAIALLGLLLHVCRLEHSCWLPQEHQQKSQYI